MFQRQLARLKHALEDSRNLFFSLLRIAKKLDKTC